MSSRRQIPGKRPELAITVGWDNPLRTYFAQVDRVDGSCILWVGSEVRECPTAEALVVPLAPYVDLQPEMIEQLRADRLADIDRGPTDLQRAWLSSLG